MIELDDSPPWETETPFSIESLRKLTTGGLTPEYARELGVRAVAGPGDLPVDFGENTGLCTVPGMLFPWRDPRDPEQVTWQYRPDYPVEPEYKYVFPKDQHQPLGLIRKATGVSSRVAIVEGTLQSLAFARYAPADVDIYAIPGCDGWSKNKNATENLVVVEGRDVIVLLDADAGTNASVYDAGHELARFSKIYGATDTFFARAPGRGVNGIDDFLGSAAEDKRAGLVERLLAHPESKPAPRKPPGKPKAKTVYGLATSEGLPDANDTYLGVDWVNKNLNQFRYLVDDDTWLNCRDGRWARASNSVPASSVLLYLNGISQLYLGAAQRYDGDKREKLEETGRMLLSSAKRTSVRTTASDFQVSHVHRSELDQHPRKFCVANGVLDLETLEVTAHDPGLLLSTGSDVEYVPDAKCPRFDRFLAEVQPDEQLRAYVMRIFAMSLFGEVREHILPVFIGEGRNGKGTAIRIMHAVFGSHAEVIEASALLVRKFEKHEQEIARLAGKRLVTTEETGSDAQWNVPRINSWTGGDRLTGRWMGGNSFTFVPSHTLVMATNHRPNVGQGERAFWARYKEVPFNVDFTDRVDLTLEPWIIENELPGVLNRLIEAGRDYLSHGLQEPSAVTMATLDAKVDADNLARYCAEHVAVTNDHELDRIPNSDLYDSVGKWWSQNVRGEVPPSNRVFPKLMRQALGFASDLDNPRKLGSGKITKRTWTGIRWLDGGGLEPLPQTHELIKNIGSMEPIIGSMAPSDSPKADYDQGHPKNSAADNSGHAADNTADVVDHDLDEPAGQEVDTADAADAADKVVSNPGSTGDTQNTPVDHGSEKVFQDVLGAVVQHRQHRPLRQHETVREGLTVFDIETDDADLQHDQIDRRDYVRLAGFTGAEGTIIEPGPDAVIERIHSSQWVAGHNITHFDLPVLERVPGSGIDVLAMARERRIIDTMIIDPVLNPVVNDKRAGEVGRILKHFGLDISCQRHGVAGKTADLSALAKEHGGYGAIPIEILTPYLEGDVAASAGLTGVLMAQLMSAPERLREYTWREHRVHAIAAVMGSEGLHVDQPLLQRRYWTTADQKFRRTLGLIRRYQIPTTKADGKKAESPAATKGGKTALLVAFHALGVEMAAFPKTVKGAPAFGREPMAELAEAYAGHANGEEIGLLAETVADINGSRTVYATAMQALRGDGRVHPRVVTLQASGRWSISDPGLTVFGKRGGRVTERAVFDTADDSTVLMTIDLSQVDARAVAVHSQDHAYMDIFGYDEQGNPRDSHAEVAKAVWGDPTLRDRAKPISHGWNYGMQLDKLTEVAGSRAVAEQFDRAMTESFGRLVSWKREMAAVAGVHGSVMDNGFGRQLRPDPRRAFTQGPALIGQGCARDLMAQCLLNIDDFDAEHGTQIIRMLRAQVHDEALFEVPREHADDVALVIESCFNFEWAPRPDMRPIAMIAKVDRHKDSGRLKLGRSWAECY